MTDLRWCFCGRVAMEGEWTVPQLWIRYGGGTSGTAVVIHTPRGCHGDGGVREMANPYPSNPGELMAVREVKT